MKETCVLTARRHKAAWRFEIIGIHSKALYRPPGIEYGRLLPEWVCSEKIHHLGNIPNPLTRGAPQ